MPLTDESLAHVDEHSAAVDTNPDAVWNALLRVLDRSFSSPRTARGARILGCADVAPSGPRPLAAGSVVPGFHIVRSEHPSELALRGRHRFSDYALIFRLDPTPSGTNLRAETRADFPGLRGSVYRSLVIGSRAHVLVTRRLLGAVKRRAEQSQREEG